MTDATNDSPHSPIDDPAAAERLALEAERRSMLIERFGVGPVPSEAETATLAAVHAAFAKWPTLKNPRYVSIHFRADSHAELLEFARWFQSKILDGQNGQKQASGYFTHDGVMMTALCWWQPR